MMSTNKRKYETRKNSKITSRNNIDILEERLDDIISISINKMLKICFNEYSYKFSYRIEKETNNVLTLHLNVDNTILDKHALLIGQFINDDVFYSKISMVESNMGYRVGTFLFDIFIYISILIKVKMVKLDNDTDDPLRAAKGIYNMFTPVNEYDENEMYEQLKYYFDNYDNLDEIYEEDETFRIKSNLQGNYSFINLKKQYNNFDDIPENLKNDVLLQEILRRNDGEMIYIVTRNSLSNIKNKIYELVRQVDLIDEPENPWNQNVYEELKKKKIIGGKNIKYKTKKYKIKNNKTKKIKIIHTFYYFFQLSLSNKIKYQK
jgi:ribosome-associated protein YbcJ (S4-like RNA binding protein)